MARNTENAFHLAIPCADLDEAARFYEVGLGCRLGRRYADRISLDFLGDQVVCHLTDAANIDPAPHMYPRHFGVTFRTEQDFDAMLKRAKDRDLPFFAKPSLRFEGLREEHRTFFLRDPSNNLIEFKWYHDPEMIY